MKQEHVLVLGVGGVMMSALARMLARSGYTVSGVDRQRSPYSDALAAEGLTIRIGHATANVTDDVAWLATSAAVPEEAPELVEARRRGLPVRSRAEVLAQFVNAGRGLCVAGTHGKTTTCGLLAVGLIEGGLDPSYLIGANVLNYGTNSRGGRSDLVVAEADEYARALLELHPYLAIVTCVEFDHPDIYADRADYHATMGQFVSQVDPDGLVLLGADNQAASSLASLARCRVQTYGLAENADWRATEPDLGPYGLGYNLHAPDGSVTPVRLPLVGLHNLQNSVAALAACAEVGLPPAQAAPLLARYQGMARRCEQLVDQGGIIVLDDYAHHPTEVRATVQGALALGRPVRVVYEPHQAARNRALLNDYAGVFEGADEVLVCDIYLAREASDGGLSAKQIAEVAGGPAHGVRYVGTFEAALEQLTVSAGPRETWLVMGAGNVSGLAHHLAEWVRANRHD